MLFTLVGVKNTIRSSTQTNMFNLSLFNPKIVSLPSQTWVFINFIRGTKWMVTNCLPIFPIDVVVVTIKHIRTSSGPASEDIIVPLYMKYSSKFSALEWNILIFRERTSDNANMHNNNEKFLFSEFNLAWVKTLYVREVFSCWVASFDNAIPNKCPSLFFITHCFVKFMDVLYNIPSALTIQGLLIL